MKPMEATPDELSVFDICCKDPDQAPDEDDDAGPIKREAKPGRNEPCWCGSGKKYKKCHLDEDERA
jgi:uncharacterized protein YecA (UPF0149 family)